MSSIAFIRRDVSQQMAAARELIDVSLQIDGILKTTSMPEPQLTSLRDAQSRIGKQIDLLLDNVNEVQQSLIQVMQTGSSR